MKLEEQTLGNPVKILLEVFDIFFCDACLNVSFPSIVLIRQIALCTFYHSKQMFAKGPLLRTPFRTKYECFSDHSRQTSKLKTMVL